MAQVGTRRRRLTNEDGAQLVEFALVLPLLLLVILAIAEFGFVFQRYEVLTNAAREGARIAVLPAYVTADVEDRVEAYLTAGGVPVAAGNPVVTVTTEATVPPAALVNTRTVTVTYTYSFQFLSAISGWFGASYTTLPMSAVSQMRIEAPVAP